VAATSTIPKLLKETEVYVKYGLHEKALDHLSRVFALEPDNTEGHEKAKTLALAMKRPEQAAESLAKLVRLYSARSDPRAAAAKTELRELAGSCAEAGRPFRGRARRDRSDDARCAADPARSR
jgi:tetratricopeptide (TPR) repeat protein